MEAIAIKSREHALDILSNVQKALDQLAVQGRGNCFLVVACSNDIDAVMRYLADSPTGENLKC